MNKKSVIKKILYPAVLIRRRIISKLLRYYQNHNLKKLAGMKYYLASGHKLNWKNPQNINEKINWLKFNTDTTIWTELADKYLVRNYVKSKGLSDILIPLYGVWDNANDIDFSQLPDKFVLKTNHGCGTVLIVKDKSKLDLSKTREKLNSWLKLEFGRETAEPHYLSIRPKIIAEGLLEQENDADLIDYKLFMANGKFSSFLIVSDRIINGSYKLSAYDENWHNHPERLAGIHINDHVAIMPKPKNFERMMQIAEILSIDFPQVRVDLYEVKGKVYFGELTFTSQGGYMTYFSKEELLRLGNNIQIPQQQK